MNQNPAQTLEQVLLEQNTITQAQLKEIQKEHYRTGETPEEIIIKNKYVDQLTLLQTKSKISGIPFIDPTQESISPEATSSVQESTARKYNIVPIARDENILSVAMQDPDDLIIIQFLERSTGLKVKAYVSTPELIKTTIDREYSKKLGENVTQAIEAAATSTKKMKETLDQIDKVEEIIKVSPVAQIVSVILEYAVKSGASDIHIEPFEEGTRIRYRIDGVLQEKFPLPKSIHNSVVARIKILANMPIDERRKPLDGKFKVEFGTSKTDLRVSSLPTVFGEKVVIRLLKDQSQTFTLEQLGVWGRGLALFKAALSETTGIILVTGPTGSGKTVTLATSLQMINKIQDNIITLEDPVEISIPGINQVQINPTAGLTFASGLRAILRQDPNIIMVGEIRDTETARLAIQASLTGHLVLATLHTNSSAGAIARLTDMGVETYLLASTINIVLAQRLTRRLCKHCAETYEPEENIKEDFKRVLGDKLFAVGMGPNPFEELATGNGELVAGNKEPVTSKLVLKRSVGCEKCNNTGYKGRIGIYEIMQVDNEIQKLAERSATTDDIQAATVSKGMITLVQDGYLKALWGITTLEEVMSVADEG